MELVVNVSQVLAERERDLCQPSGKREREKERDLRQPSGRERERESKQPPCENLDCLVLSVSSLMWMFSRTSMARTPLGL